MKHNIEPPDKSREKELRGKGRFSKLGTRIKMKSKIQKEKCAKQARKKEKRNLDLFGPGSLATFLILAVW